MDPETYERLMNPPTTLRDPVADPWGGPPALDLRRTHAASIAAIMRGLMGRALTVPEQEQAGDFMVGLAHLLASDDREVEAFRCRLDTEVTAARRRRR